MSGANRGGSKSSTPTNQGGLSRSGTSQSSQSKSNNSVSSQGGTSKSNTHSDNSQSSTPLSPHDGVSAGSGTSPSLSSAASDVTMESVGMAMQDQEGSDGLKKNLDRTDDKPESTKNIATVQDLEQAPLDPNACTPVKDDGLWLKLIHFSIGHLKLNYLLF